MCHCCPVKMESIFVNPCDIYVVDYYKYPGHEVGIPNSPTVGAFRRDAREYIHVSSTAASLHPRAPSLASQFTLQQTVLNWVYQPHALAVCLDSKILRGSSEPKSLPDPSRGEIHR